MPKRYIVHGADAKGNAAQKIIEAESSGEAEGKAAKLGLSVAGSEIDPSWVRENGGGAGRAGQAAFPDDTPMSRRLGPEQELWKGTPSQWLNFWWWVGIITIPIAAWKWLETKCTKFTLTTQRLRIEKGVLSKSVDEVELYRIKDTQLNQTVIDRMLNIGTIEVLSSDETNPTLLLPKVPNPREVREQLRTGVERVRLARGVRELDVSWENAGNP